MGTPVEVVMPQIGDEMTEGTITRWLVEVGAVVERDQPLFEISTDRVDAEVPSPREGVLSRILYPEGTTIPVNAVVALISDRIEVGAGQQAVEPISSGSRRGATSSANPASQVQVGDYRMLNELVGLSVAAFTFSILSSYLGKWLPLYAASGVSSFISGLILYPAVGAKNGSLGRWILLAAFFSVCLSIGLLANGFK